MSSSSSPRSLLGETGAFLRRAARERRVPRHVVENLLGRLRRAVSTVVGKTIGALLNRRYAGCDERVVRGEMGWGPAQPLKGRRPAELPVETLRHVSEVLGAVSVPFFVSGRPGPLRTSLCVERKDRVTALSALESAAGPTVRMADASPGRKRREAGPHSTEVDVWFDVYAGDHVVFGPETGVRLEFRDSAYNDPPDAELEIAGHRYPTYEAIENEMSNRVFSGPIDVVYTWVDGSDPAWADSYAETVASTTALHAQAANTARYQPRDLLRYSLRSLWWYAGFVDRVFIVTAGQIPVWLDTSHPAIEMVDHRDLLSPDALPTFNSHAIESRLHHIDGLSEHFLYFNDDVLLGRPVTSETFFEPDGRLRVVFTSEEIPHGEATPHDTPVNAAAKNGRDLLEGELGYVAKHKTAHVPFPQSRTLLFDLEQRFSERFLETEKSRFRDPADLSIPSFLSQHAALALDRAVIGDLRYRYVNVIHRWARDDLAGVLENRDVDVVCVNETEVDDRAEAKVEALVSDFAERFLPEPASFEVSRGNASYMP